MDKETRDEFADIKRTLTAIHDKLFVGNGQPPITVQIDRLNRLKTFAYWFFGATFVAFLGLAVRVIYGHISK